MIMADKDKVDIRSDYITLRELSDFIRLLSALIRGKGLFQNYTSRLNRENEFVEHPDGRECCPFANVRCFFARSFL
jgi:hypothetical protein